MDSCDDDEEINGFLESNTIDELKLYAEKNEFDGFAIFTGTPSLEWHTSVLFKKCTTVQLDEHLPHALVR